MSELRALALEKRYKDGTSEYLGWVDEEGIASLLSFGHMEMSIGFNDIRGRADTITLAEADRIAKLLVTGIFEDWSRLRCIVHKYGNLLQKRWMKKTGEQREKTLLAAWPGMTRVHRPDINNLKKIDILGENERVKVFRDDSYFPYINLEDMARPRTFLVLLDSRTRCTPDAFANADMNSIRVGLRYCDTIKPKYIKGYTMHLVGETKPTTYGRITCWRGNLDSAYAWVAGIGTQPGDGLIILEIQRRIFKFLLECTEIVLHDISFGDVCTSARPDDTYCGLKNYLDREDLSHLATLMEAPYLVPDQFDFARLQNYINAKRGEVEDHLWLLHEDPAYLAEALRESIQHEREALFVDDWTQVPEAQTDAFWDRVLVSLLTSVYRDVMLWNMVWQALQELQTLRQHHRSTLLPGRKLPKDYKLSLFHFAYLVEEIIRITTELANRAIMGCRSFHKHFLLKKQVPDDGSIQVDMQRDHTDELWWLVYQLIVADDLEPIGLPSLLAEIERLIAIDGSQKDRLSPRLARIISEFSVLAEIQRQLGLYSPGGRIFAAVPDSEISNVREKRFAPLKAVMKPMVDITGIEKFELDMASLDYPIDKARTAVTNAQMRNAEARLDSFWHSIDTYFIEQTGKTLHAHVGSCLELRKLSRTPEWIEPRRTTKSTAEPSDAITASLMHATLEERTERTVNREPALPAKDKPKTRSTIPTPLAPPVNSVPESADVPAVSVLPPLGMKITKRTHRVITMLFRVSTEDGVAGELPWTEFLHAMTVLGFAVHKLDGSASLFSPTSGDLNRSIIFHEPHPVRKISLSIARRYGRRLTRAFGWTAESFVRA